AEGRVWFRVAGWRDWLYRYPEKTRNFNRKPCLHCISAERLLPRLSARSVCREVSRADVRDVTLTWLERLFLNDEEVEEFRGLKLPKRQWEWMLGRIAAKDAIRVWHARESGSDELLHPVSITVAKDDRGRPFVRCAAAIPQPPTISISHSHERAIAVASDESVGIDLEAASAVSEELLASVCRDDELENMRRQMVYDPQGAWPARLWAAKEAAGKALGTGLNARPTDFAVIDWEPDGQVLIRHEPSDEQLIVFTQLEGASVIAYTSRPKANALSDAVPSQIQIGS
ncbi:MAG: 4'-phosphopantetheinyl transferase superfamily protein, partial [Pirellulales bacterium]